MKSHIKNRPPKHIFPLWIRTIFFRIADNSIFSWFILPLAMYNIADSYRSMKIQYKELVKVINENDKFAKSLFYYGFKPQKFYRMSSIHETDLEMTDEEIYDVANKQIIIAVKNFLHDELLFTLVKIEILRLPDLEIRIDLQPADKNLFFVDLRNLIYSILITSAIALVFALLL